MIKLYYHPSPNPAKVALFLEEAGLPYEVFIVGNKVYSLYARYRIALAWPALGMGQFMGIINAPEAIRATMVRVAGGGN